ncbi:MAG: hypothetical protein R2695_03665 [Acidimicrobiales bacterium]
MTLPTEDPPHHDKAEAEARMVMAMGGRAASRSSSTSSLVGGANDLQQATNIARRMITEWGMSEVVGLMSLADGARVFLGDDTDAIPLVLTRHRPTRRPGDPADAGRDGRPLPGC